MHFLKAALLIAQILGLAASDAVADDMNVKRQSWQNVESAALSSASAAAAEANRLADSYARRALAPAITPGPMLNRFHGKRQDWQSVVSDAESLASGYASFGKTVADDYTSDALAIASSGRALASSVVSDAESVAATAAASSAVASAESVAASAGASAGSSATQDNLAAREFGSSHFWPSMIAAVAVGCAALLV